MLVERKARFVMLVKLQGRATEVVVKALAKKVQVRVKVYSCDPHNPWQRGSNENADGLLRQYFPEDTDLSRQTQPYLDAVADQQNPHPRLAHPRRDVRSRDHYCHDELRASPEYPPVTA